MASYQLSLWQTFLKTKQPIMTLNYLFFKMKLLLLIFWAELVVHIVITYRAFKKAIKNLIQKTWKGIQNQWLIALLCGFQGPGL